MVSALAVMNEYSGLVAMVTTALLAYIFIRQKADIQAAKAEILDRMDAKMEKIHETYFPMPRNTEERPVTRRELEQHEAAAQRELTIQARVNASFEAAISRVDSTMSRVETVVVRVDSTWANWHTRLGNVEEKTSRMEYDKLDRSDARVVRLLEKQA